MNDGKTIQLVRQTKMTNWEQDDKPRWQIESKMINQDDKLRASITLIKKISSRVIQNDDVVFSK